MESLNNVVVNDSTESSDLLSYLMVTDAGFVFFDLKKGIHEDYLKITQSKSMDDAFEYHRERIFLQKSELVQFRSVHVHKGSGTLCCYFHVLFSF